MLNNFKKITIGILLAALVIAAGATTFNAYAQSATAPTSYGSGVDLLNIPASSLSADEAASLLFMREEEKLARDVYNALYATWAYPTFQNIAASEQKHMDAIKVLLDRYALTDPALAPGKFTDPTLQALYDQLVAQGSISLAEAFKVGAAIEEIDIRDLQTRTPLTDNADIQWVYNSLLNGSYNHLKAFTNALSRQTGETYQPQFLSADVYQSIVTGSMSQGNQGGNGQGMSGRSQGMGRGGRWQKP